MAALSIMHIIDAAMKSTAAAAAHSHGLPPPTELSRRLNAETNTHLHFFSPCTHYRPYSFIYDT